jgi:subtilisin family serine protease
MTRYALLLGLVVFAACQDTTEPQRNPAPRAALVNMDGNVPGAYIVVADWDTDAAGLAAEYGITTQHTYKHLLNGFSAANVPDDVVQRLAADPRVLRISMQRQMQRFDTQLSPGSWGLDRIDQRALPLDQAYTYDADAATVRAYILDMGLRATHSEFEGRAVRGFDAFTWDPTDATQQQLLGSAECDSHATHVAGTVGSKTYGVAKKVQLVGVRVLNCAGYGNDADVIAGMDWVAEHGTLPAVANMSLGDFVPGKALGTSTEIDNALKALIASGVVTVVAAGNGWGSGAAPGYDACNHPLANVREAIVVGASERNSSTAYAFDRQTAWTSYGPCVDVYAPGSSIMSSTSVSDVSSGTNSGTSMAAPHVAGVAALILAQNPNLTPAQVQDIIVTQATPNVIQKNANNTTAAADPTPLLMLYSRPTVPPVTELKKNGKPVPCTPRRQRDGQC